MDDSPLLRLPPEIRDTIYTLVLGGNDVHVRNVGASLSHSICTEVNSHGETVKHLKRRELEELDFPEELDHYNCATHGAFSHAQPQRQTLSDLSLLLACRQIYQEAALIPFKTNTFVCSNALQLGHFFHTLTTSQRKSVANVCLVTSQVELCPTYLSECMRGRGLIRVQRLIVVLGIANKTEAHEVGRFLSMLERSFDPHSMTEVETVIRFRKTKSSLAELRELHQMYAEWARETEQALLVKVREERR